MNAGIAMNALGQGFMIMLIVSGFIVVPSFVAGLLISIFQATTQIQEQSLTFIPKFLISFAVIFLMGPYLLGQLSNHFLTMINLISKI